MLDQITRIRERLSIEKIQFFKEAGLGAVWKVFAMLIALVQVPLLLEFIGEVNYGIWVTLLSLGNWMQLLDIGMGNGLRNMLALDLGEGKTSQSKKYVSTVYAVLFVFTSVFLLLVAPFLEIIPWDDVLNINSNEAEDMSFLILLVLVLIGYRFVMRLILSIYAAHGRTSISNLVPVVANGLGILILLVARSSSYELDLTDVVILFGGMPLLVLLVLNVGAFWTSYRSIRPSFSAIDFKSTGSLMRLSGQFFLTQITALIIYSSIPIVISVLLGPTSVAEFDVANKIFMIPIIAMGLLNAPLLPMITRKFGEGNFAWIKSTLFKMRMISWITLLGTLILAIVSPFIFEVWLNGKVEVSTSIIVAFSIYASLSILNHPFSVAVNALGRLKEAVILGPVGILLFIFSSWILTKWFQDVSVIPLALALTSLIGLIVFPVVIRKELKSKHSYE